MRKRRALVILLLISLGLGLHLTFQHLSHQLPGLFPQIVRETIRPEGPPSLPSAGSGHGPSSSLISATFQVPDELVPMVDFWRQIYAVYDTKQVVFHNTENLGVQYKVLDFTGLEERQIADSEKKAIRDLTVREELARLRSVYGETVRAQVGLRDRFLEGLKRSQRTMPAIEEIFQNYGIPREISRLAFVESLFNERAFSKAGAAGLWQFMPGTARHYMTVNHQIDERYNPLVATRGAARLLLKNYNLLGTWPLAINAYNSGPANLQKAISAVGTRDIATIIRGYKGGSYAFASRNFYPSFLAVLEIYENQEKYFGPGSNYDADTQKRGNHYPSPPLSSLKNDSISTGSQ